MAARVPTTDRSQEPREYEIMSKKFGCLSMLVLAGGLFWLAIFTYINIWPERETVVKLPMGDSVARFQVWYGLYLKPPYFLTVDTPRGSISTELWTNWGPARSINLYQTPENWLVGIGGGGASVIIDVMNPSGPKSVDRAERVRTNDENWKYLGRAYISKFITAREKPECIELFGAGDSPYRKKFQAQSFCP